MEGVKLCRKMKVPHFYFIDDNFPLLAKEMSDFSQYAIENLRKELASFSGVIATSEILAEYYRKNKIHDNISVITCAYDNRRLNKYRRIRQRAEIGADPTELRFASFGGPFRNKNLRSQVLPALDNLKLNVKLMLRDDTSVLDGVKLKRLRVQLGHFTPLFDAFLENWAMAAPHVVLHPKGLTSNIAYKSDNAALVSLYLGAVPILPEEEAYRNLDASCGVEKVDGSRQSWSRAIQKLTDAEYRAEMLDRLDRHCQQRFSTQSTDATVSRLLEPVSPLDADKALERYRLGVDDAMTHYVEQLLR
jgi:hypothetical protein